MFRGVSVHAITWYNAGRLKENWKPLETIFREMKAAGYDGVEYDRRLPFEQSSLELKRMAADCGLAWVCQKVNPPDDVKDQAGWDAFRQDLDTALALEVSVGTTGASKRPKTPEERAERMKRIAESMEKGAQLCREAGIALAIHNHWRQLLESREEIETMLGLAPSLSLLFDTAHLQLCGGGLLELIGKHAARIAHVHLKDLDTARPTVTDERLGKPQEWPNFKEIGQGKIDFTPIFAALEKSGYRGWLSVELDWASRDPFEAHKACREALRGYGY